ncbi:MAG: peptide-methionine (S)-S-oxide reductase MsrA, partial [Methanobacterium paludis]|nr:peptide-methionine (S)-S-oxide reductase MsrA [Methanobacterium paludis]
HVLVNVHEFTFLVEIFGLPFFGQLDHDFVDISSDFHTFRLWIDPLTISYNELLDVFWEVHDPTTPNRQGPDIGEQYRSVIFYHNEEQKKLADVSKKKLQGSGRYGNDIVTEIIPASKFWTAEEYHQRYLEKRGRRFCGL